MMLPEAPSKMGTTLNLFTRSNRDAPQLIDDNDNQKLKNSNFDISKRTIFIVHGFTENILTWGVRMKGALLSREDCNVILVDWSKGAKWQENQDNQGKLLSGVLQLPELYRQAAGNTRLVGAQIAELIRFLISSNSGSSDWAHQFYIVGFSLGAHVAGYAGRNLKESGMVLGRITGLDPAGPAFSHTDPAVRLDPTDAKHVDIIHTDTVKFGISQESGHIDFFPNGGYTQPGCDLNLFDLTETVVCNHRRSTEYYIASVQNLCSWKAYPCSEVFFLLGICGSCKGECPSLGYAADRTKKTGRHYLKTNNQPPFCGLS